MTEAQLQDAIRELARIRGWMYFHPYDSRRSTPGFPDLILVHPRTGQLIAAELKSATGRLTDAQKQWIGALYRAGIDVRVWRPEDLTNGAIAAALTPTGAAAAHRAMADQGVTE
jgi:hypothetical protein